MTPSSLRLDQGRRRRVVDLAEGPKREKRRLLELLQSWMNASTPLMVPSHRGQLCELRRKTGSCVIREYTRIAC